MIDPSMNTDLTDTEVADGDQAAREALAARVREAAVPDLDAEAATRRQLAHVEHQLAEARELRDATEDRIRALVWHVETLQQAVGVFDRRAAKRAEAEQ